MKYKNNSADDTKEIFVVVTNACNLRCSYCYETNKNAPSIDVERIKTELIQELRNNSSAFKRFLVNFHGGEPFLAFPKMRLLVEWMLNYFSDLDITFTCTTNGTLLTDTIKTWLIKNKDVFIPILSLDGNEYVHNLNRDASFQKIPIEFFKEHWPLQGVKMTVAPNTIGRMFESFLFIQNNGLYANPSLAGEAEWSLHEHLPIYECELSKLADFYIRHPCVKPAPILNLPLKKFSPFYRNSNGNGCGAGLDTVALDVHGNRYPCHTFISDLKKPYEKEKIAKLFSILHQNCNTVVAPRCEGCFIINCCSPCYGLNYSYRGDMGNFDKTRCEFNKSTVRCAAMMFARIIPNYVEYPWMKAYSEQELYHLIEGIKYIHKMS